MREIWMMQPRLERRTGNAPLTLVEQPRFRAGLDFLRLRGESGEVDPELARWWEAFSLAEPERRREMLAAARERDGPRRIPGAAGTAGARPAAAVTAAGDADGAPARKRRRRRRKPAGAAGSGDDAPSDTTAAETPEDR
jgi:poly(A) polymerase